MVRKLLFVLLVATPLLAAEAPSKARRLEAINRQMWLPFLEGIRTDRAELYVGVHANDFHWVGSGNRGRIMDLAEYDEDSRLVMKQRKDAGERFEIEIRFLERNVTDDFAAEKCITKFVLHRPGQPSRTSYRIAHYFSRKENGVWKMGLQYNSAEPATETMFEAAAPLEEIARFAA